MQLLDVLKKAKKKGVVFCQDNASPVMKIEEYIEEVKKGEKTKHDFVIEFPTENNPGGIYKLDPSSTYLEENWIRLWYDDPRKSYNKED